MMELKKMVHAIQSSLARSRKRELLPPGTILSKYLSSMKAARMWKTKGKERKEEAARIAAAAKKAEEEEKLRKATCESLIRNAKELKEAGKYKNALSQLAKARDLGVAEALNQIRDLEKEIKEFERSQQSDQTADRLVWKDSGRIITNYITLI